jgi:hypothetical protein
MKYNQFLRFKAFETQGNARPRSDKGQQEIVTRYLNAKWPRRMRHLALIGAVDLQAQVTEDVSAKYFKNYKSYQSHIRW